MLFSTFSKYKQATFKEEPVNLTPRPTSNAPLFLMAAHRSHSPTPDAGISGIYHDVYSHGMDRAMGSEQASIEAAVNLQSSVAGIMEQADWYTPALCNLLDMAVQSLKSCLDLQLIWLSILAPQAITPSQASSHLLELVPQGEYDCAAHEEADGFEYSMDIALGTAEDFEPYMEFAATGQQAA